MDTHLKRWHILVVVCFQLKSEWLNELTTNIIITVGAMLFCNSVGFIMYLMNDCIFIHFQKGLTVTGIYINCKVCWINKVELIMLAFRSCFVWKYNEMKVIAN